MALQSGSEDPLLQPGAVVDEFVIEELFSMGHSSAVYRARQPALNRTVAIKVLPRARSSDARWVGHFRRGAQMLAQITHPNIVPVYGTGRHDEREYLAMLFVPGGKSFDRAFDVSPGGPDLSTFLKAALDVGRALAFVHDQGLVHGDVKPSNILVGEKGSVFLIDFDVARREDDSARVSLVGARQSAFLAPEALEHGGVAEDHRSDLYSFGATLYAVLAGAPPRRPDPVKLANARPDIPSGVCAVIERCLDPDKHSRFTNASELVAALEELIEGLSSPGPGRRLGNFQIVSELGRGGIGVVYCAIQEPLGREVALKVLPPEFSAVPSRVRRFQREAEAISRLDHRNIIPIHAFGRLGGWHYFAMKLVRGGTLAAIVDRQRAAVVKSDSKTTDSFNVEFQTTLGGAGSTTVERTTVGASATPGADAVAALRLGQLQNTDPAYVSEVTRVFIKVAGALAHAHQHGILHRDVKPANIILDESGEPYVLDFGLARDETDLGLTESAGVIGTPYYMAPEQINPTEGAPDRRTDVWGLGISLFETLCGRRPFESASRDALFNEITQSAPPSLRKLNPAVSRDLEALVEKALARKREDRYSDLTAMAIDLERSLAGRTVSAKPQSILQRAVKSVRRRRVSTSTALAFSVAAVVITAALVFLVTRIFGGGQSGLAGRLELRMPPDVALVVRIQEQPQLHDVPAIDVVAAAWDESSQTAWFPCDLARPAPPGFEPERHGQIVWILPHPKLPLSVTDPATYASGRGFAVHAERLRSVLPDVVAAVVRGSRVSIRSEARNATVAYHLDPTRADPSPPAPPSIATGKATAMRLLRCAIKEGVVLGFDAISGSLLRDSDGGRFIPSFPVEAGATGGVLVSNGNRALGFLRQGRAVVTLGDALALR